MAKKFYDKEIKLILSSISIYSKMNCCIKELVQQSFIVRATDIAMRDC